LQLETCPIDVFYVQRPIAMREVRFFIVHPIKANMQKETGKGLGKN
jgi:hypothetical protein